MKNESLNSKSDSGSQIIESDFDQKISKDLKKSTEIFENLEKSKWGSTSQGWQVASKLVTKVRPVPWIFWTMIRASYGRTGIDYKEVDPLCYSVVENMIFRARYEHELLKDPEFKLNRNFTESVNVIGADTIASYCFIHAICRRLTGFLSDRIYKAIIEDALLRARLGLLLSEFSSTIRPGMGLLAGFGGRAGLAVQLASGTEEQAKQSLNGLATGKDITKVGYEVYDCDPLQVAALSMIAGGCNSDIAIGISSFSSNREDSILDDEKSLWLTVFSAIENIRIGKFDTLSIDTINRLGINYADTPNFLTSAQLIFRQGHKLGWIKLGLSEMANFQ